MCVCVCVCVLHVRFVVSVLYMHMYAYGGHSFVVISDNVHVNKVNKIDLCGESKHQEYNYM